MKKQEKMSLTVMIDKENTIKLRKLVFGLKAQGEKINISQVINDSLTKLFADEDIKASYADILE